MIHDWFTIVTSLIGCATVGGALGFIAYRIKERITS